MYKSNSKHSNTVLTVKSYAPVDFLYKITDIICYAHYIKNAHDIHLLMKSGNKDIASSAMSHSLTNEISTFICRNSGANILLLLKVAAILDYI